MIVVALRWMGRVRVHPEHFPHHFVDSLNLAYMQDKGKFFEVL
jgi:hypothetical protein